MFTPMFAYVRTAEPGLQADYFIGSCPSSFTSFVSRYRKARGVPTEFWGVPLVDGVLRAGGVSDNREL